MFSSCCLAMLRQLFADMKKWSGNNCCHLHCRNIHLTSPPSASLFTHCTPQCKANTLRSSSCVETVICLACSLGTHKHTYMLASEKSAQMINHLPLLATTVGGTA